MRTNSNNIHGLVFASPGKAAQGNLITPDYCTVSIVESRKKLRVRKPHSKFPEDPAQLLLLRRVWQLSASVVKNLKAYVSGCRFTFGLRAFGVSETICEVLQALT